MKKFVLITINLIVLTLFIGGVVFAQGLIDNTTDTEDNHTAREEAEGKIVWEKLQAKQVQCSDLLDDDFGALGEYFMGQMIGASHETMNNMMARMMGEQGEEQMHVVMGKRLSGCDASAAYPAQGRGFIPMMGMMGGWPIAFNNNLTNPEGTANKSFGVNNPMMWNFGNNPMGWGFGAFGWFFMILWWIIIIVAIAAVIKWLAGQSRDGKSHEKSSLDILKDRYAKGEIDKKEYEEKKKDLA